MTTYGLYKINNSYFSDFQGRHWVDNKNENRPYYYVIKDAEGVDWVIPLSTQVENYRVKIAREEEKRGGGNCLYYYIGKIAGVDRVFLIGDMFPVSDKYIKEPFTIQNIPYVVRNQSLNATVYSKAMRYLKLVEKGVMKSRNNVLEIKRELINKADKE